MNGTALDVNPSNLLDLPRICEVKYENDYRFIENYGKYDLSAYLNLTSQKETNKIQRTHPKSKYVSNASIKLNNTSQPDKNYLKAEIDEIDEIDEDFYNLQLNNLKADYNANKKKHYYQSNYSNLSYHNNLPKLLITPTNVSNGLSWRLGHLREKNSQLSNYSSQHSNKQQQGSSDFNNYYNLENKNLARIRQTNHTSVESYRTNSNSKLVNSSLSTHLSNPNEVSYYAKRKVALDSRASDRSSENISTSNFYASYTKKQPILMPNIKKPVNLESINIRDEQNLVNLGSGDSGNTTYRTLVKKYEPPIPMARTSSNFNFNSKQLITQPPLQPPAMQQHCQNSKPSYMTYINMIGSPNTVPKYLTETKKLKKLERIFKERSHKKNDSYLNLRTSNNYNNNNVASVENAGEHKLNDGYANSQIMQRFQEYKNLKLQSKQSSQQWTKSTKINQSQTTFQKSANKSPTFAKIKGKTSTPKDKITVIQELYDSIYNEKQNELDFKNIKEVDGSFSSIASIDSAIHDTQNLNDTNEETLVKQSCSPYEKKTKKPYQAKSVQENLVEQKNISSQDESIISRNYNNDSNHNNNNNNNNNSHIDAEILTGSQFLNSQDEFKADMNEIEYMLSQLVKKPALKQLPKIKPRESLVKTQISPRTEVEAKSSKKERKRRVSFKIDASALKQNDKHFRVPVKVKGISDDMAELDNEDVHRLSFSDNWLLKWCILRENRTRLCQKAFESCDTERKGYLTLNQLMTAVNSIVHLENFKNNYFVSVLNLCEINQGVDLNIFNILISLAYRIDHLDDLWFKNILPQLDFSTIENKIFKVKNLWNYLADKRSKTINIKDLLIEFEAGGVTHEHVKYARGKFKDKSHFDLLDYLTYIPLFVYIHDRIVLNPFDKSEDI